MDRGSIEALRSKPSSYDSHPAPSDRIFWVPATGAMGVGASADDDREAWSVHSSREAIEHRMTLQVRENVLRTHGIQIPGGTELAM